MSWQDSTHKFFERHISFKVAAALTVLLSLTVLLPVVLFGIPYFPDQIHHYQIASSYAQAISNGDFFPSWAADENFGYGGLGVRLYPPLSYYILALTHLATGEWYWASLLTYAFWLSLGGFGIYLLAREFYSSNLALFASVIFAFMPYRFFELYAATMYGEFAGCAVLPFSFYFVCRLCREGKTLDLIGLSAAFAILIITHLPLAVIGSICLFIFSLASLQRGQIFRTVLRLASSVFISLILSAFFWVRVLTERDWVAGNSIYPLPQLNYSKNFIFNLNDDVLRIEYFDLFFLLPLIFVTISFLSYLFVNQRKKTNYTASLVILFIFSSVMTLKISFPLWQTFPLLQEVQFPWRFLTVTAISGAILATAGWQHLILQMRSSKRPVILILGGGLFILIAFSFLQVARNSTFMSQNEFTRWRDDNDEVAGLEFWWTIWARREAVKPSEKVLAEDREIDIEKWTATQREFNVSPGEPRQARIAIFYYPYWRAAINDAQTEVNRSDDGAIILALPAEKASVRLFFQEPWWLKIIWKLSGIGWACLLLFGFFQLAKSIKILSNKRNISDENVISI